jgi:hypothetical protein
VDGSDSSSSWAFLPAQALCNAVLNQKFFAAFEAFASREQDYIHRRVEDERSAAVRTDDPVPKSRNSNEEPFSSFCKSR